jgi:hypothetical protein
MALVVSTSRIVLLDCFACRALDVFDLAPTIALRAEIVAVEQLGLNMLKPHTGGGRMFCPSHVSPMKIAAINRIRVKLVKRPDFNFSFKMAPLPRILRPAFFAQSSLARTSARNSAAYE